MNLVQVRNDLCHGNILKFVNEELGEDAPFFTPECLRGLSEVLRGLSHRWAEELGTFRRDKLACELKRRSPWPGLRLRGHRAGPEGRV